MGQPLPHPIREATAHHAGDGSLSIRQGRWKLEKTGSSGVERLDALLESYIQRGRSTPG
ncbi:MAG: hypothetical protein ABGY72_00725 [bacterium]